MKGFLGKNKLKKYISPSWRLLNQPRERIRLKKESIRKSSICRPSSKPYSISFVITQNKLNVQ